MKGHRQRDRSDCAAACLACIADHYRLRLSPAFLRRELGTTAAGTSAAELLRVAGRLGFSARGVKGPIDALVSVPLPAIAHCLIDGRHLHYVVLAAWDARSARVMDPAVGRVQRWTRKQFAEAWSGILIILAPSTGFEPGNRTVAPWRRLAGLLRPHAGLLLQAFAGSVFLTVLGLASSFYVQVIVDSVIPSDNRQLLNLVAVAMLAVLAFRLAVGFGQSLISLHLAQRIDVALILTYYRHLLHLPSSFFDTMRVGEITSRVADAVKIRTFLNGTLLGLLLNPLIVLFSLGAFLLYSPEIAGLSCALLPVNLLIHWLSGRINRVWQRDLLEKSADFEAHLVESLQAQGTLRAFQLERWAAWRTETRLVRLLRTNWRATVATIATTSAVTAVTSLYAIAILWLGARLVLSARLTPGELMSCYTLSGYLTGPLAAIVGANAAIHETLAATDRLFEIIDLELEKDHGLVAAATVFSTGSEIRFEQVSFRHPGRASGLTDLSFSLPAGRITLLAAESGGGKSTLLGLLQRNHQPDSGRILLGNCDLRHFRLTGLRSALAVVPQEIRLLSGTVLENLAPGVAEPDPARLLELCRRLGALDFIEKLPRGFLTHLPENGRNLSGGQRQRLALVRAFYRDVPILLLDEPTSALDTAAEQRVIDLLEERRAAGRTIVIAAHDSRLAGIADRVITLSAGTVGAIREISHPVARPAPGSISAQIPA